MQTMLLNKLMLITTNFVMFFQDATPPDAVPDASGGAAAAAAAGVFFLVFTVAMLAFALLMVASLWKLFVKAGEPGWAALVPIYNLVVMLKIIDKPIWWIVLFFIPGVNAVAGLMLYYELGQKFGKGIGFIIGMIIMPFIFLPMLAFGSAKYQR